jgi:phosphoglycolate phosphatase-like HAD superfamily hydrolase
MRPLYIFDLDGTLADIRHRRHFVERDRKDWRSFFAACVDDEPIPQAIETLRCLHRGGAEIWVWSGRSDEVREETVRWLKRHRIWRCLPWFVPEKFRMRKAGDHQPDDKLKSIWLSEIEPTEYDRLTAIFDDRKRVVDMWRSAGVPCYQVAPGEF